MTLEEQRVFEQTRQRIQVNLAEIASLSRTSAPPPEFFPKFLRLACECLNARGGAVWAIEGGTPSRIAELEFASTGYDADVRQKSWVEAVLAACLSTRRPHIVAADDPSQSQKEVPEGQVGNTVPHPFFYHPVTIGERTVAILQIWLPAAGDPRTYNEIATFIGQVGHHAENYLRGWQGTLLATKNEQAQLMLRLQGELVGELDPKVLHNSAVNYLVDLLRADLTCLFMKRGRKWRLVGASNQEVVDAKAVQSLSLARVATVLPSSEIPRVLALDETDEAVRAAMEETGIRRLAWCHLRSSKNSAPDVLLVGAKNSEGNFPANTIELLSWTGAQLARALDAATHFHHIPLRGFASAAGRTVRAWNQNRRRKVLTWVVAPVVILAAAMLVPVPWKIAADCSVMPQRRAVVVAETTGKITDVLVREGDLVDAGQVVATLDDTDYVTQLAVANQQLLRWRVEVGRAQALGNEAERKIAELSAAREEEAIGRIEFLRSRTRLTSPIAGMVLTRNLANREGESIELGKPFCEIGGTQAYELILDIRQKDLGDILTALDDGDKLPLSFILHPHPQTALSAALSSPDQISQTPELRKDGSVFLARVPFPPDSPLQPLLKPGFTGKAKVDMGHRALGWVLFRPFWNYLRMHWGH